VIDTLAKWYELNPYLKVAKPATDLSVISDIAKRAFDSLTNNTDIALKEAENGIVGDAAIQVIDSIIFLAGLSGSIKSEETYTGIAHVFYNMSTQVIPAPQMLHGEKVGFGLLLQQVMQREDKKSIKDSIRLFFGYLNLFTLKDFGLDTSFQPQVATIARLIANELQNDLPPTLDIDNTVQGIESAIYEINSMVHNSQEYQRVLEQRLTL
jgi:glycerol dehydrogenase